MEIEEFLSKISDAIVNPLIRLMFAVATVVFAWGIIQFVISAESDEKREQGKQTMVWGILGMFIMLAVYGIIGIILGTFDVPIPSNLRL